jgi:hypothetical protein
MFKKNTILENTKEFDINDCKYEYLLYTSKKCATETLKNTFLKNNININPEHIHYMHDKDKLNLLNFKKFDKYLINTINNNKNKINIITIIRDPIDKMVSEFYFSYYWENEIKNKFITNVNLIEKYNIICDMFNNNNNNLINQNSLNEIVEYYNIDINKIVNHGDYYIYNDNKLFKLYILKFNNIIKDKNKYINKIFKIDVDFNSKNLSSELYSNEILKEIKNIKYKIKNDNKLFTKIQNDNKLIYKLL